MGVAGAVVTFDVMAGLVRVVMAGLVPGTYRGTLPLVRVVHDGERSDRAPRNPRMGSAIHPSLTSASP
jgi:hypothetical protein